MNTVSHHSNLELIHFIRDHLAQLGVHSRLTFNADKTKANLLATLDEGKPAGVILSGHTDTVPWDAQEWSMAPAGRRGAGRQALWPGQRRHEVVHRRGLVAGRAVPEQRGTLCLHL